MTERKNSRGRRQIILIALVLSCITLLTVAAWSSVPRPQLEKAPHIINETNLHILEARINGDDLHLSFRNTYSKNINCFLVSIGSDTIRTEFAYIDKVIAPGAIYQQTYSIEQGKTGSIRMRAVMFDDGTSDGELKAVKEIKDERLGVRMQLESIIPQLHTLLNLPEAEIQPALDRLESQILSLSEGKQSLLTEDVKLGLHNGKAYLLRIIQELKSEQQTDGIRERLNRIKKQQEKIVSRL